MPGTAIELYIKSQVHETLKVQGPLPSYRTGTVSAGSTYKGKKLNLYYLINN